MQAKWIPSKGNKWKVAPGASAEKWGGGVFSWFSGSGKLHRRTRWAARLDNITFTPSHFETRVPMCARMHVRVCFLLIHRLYTTERLSHVSRRGAEAAAASSPWTPHLPWQLCCSTPCPPFLFHCFVFFFLIDKLELAAAANAGLARCAHTHTHTPTAGRRANFSNTHRWRRSHHHQHHQLLSLMLINSWEVWPIFFLLFFLRRLDVTKPNVVLIWNGLLKINWSQG